jgi:hypothetical protein
MKGEESALGFLRSFLTPVLEKFAALDDFG